jgi:hypothetical protein
MLKEIKSEENVDEGGRQEKKMHKGKNSWSSCSTDTTEEKKPGRV